MVETIVGPFDPDTPAHGAEAARPQAPAAAAKLAAGIASRIAQHRFGFANEDELQQGLAACLADHHKVEREVLLSARDRIDLLVDGRIGIEVKVGGTLDALERQVTRYAHSDRVEALVVVTSRIQHGAISTRINGKSVLAVSLAGAGL